MKVKLMNKFKVGQKVIFVPRNPNFCEAKAGATATVNRLDRVYLNVRWHRDVKSGSQSDGGYDYEDFKPAGGQQLLFSFMKEV